MTKEAITSASPLSLFRIVFGLKPGQTLSEFSKECAPLREDAKFVAECREYALTNCATE